MYFKKIIYQFVLIFACAISVQLMTPARSNAAGPAALIPLCAGPQALACIVGGGFVMFGYIVMTNSSNVIAFPGKRVRINEEDLTHLDASEDDSGWSYKFVGKIPLYDDDIGKSIDLFDYKMEKRNLKRAECESIVQDVQTRVTPAGTVVHPTSKKTLYRTEPMIDSHELFLALKLEGDPFDVMLSGVIFKSKYDMWSGRYDLDRERIEVRSSLCVKSLN